MTNNNAPPRTDQQPTIIKLKVDVDWGDIRKVDGDIYAVGHYENVLPQNAERVLDTVVSAPGCTEADMVLRNLSRRGILRGALGDIAFFPWTRANSEDKHRLVAVAGMGHVGSFGPPQLRRLARNLTWAISALPDVQTVCTVLIGAGVGNMPVTDAVTGMMLGLVDAMGLGMPGTGVSRLRFVELELGTARAIHRQLVRLRDAPELQGKIQIELDPSVNTDSELGGRVSDDYCMTLTLAAAAAVVHDANEERRSALTRLLESVQHPPTFSKSALDAFTALTGKLEAGQPVPDVADIASKLAVEFTPRPGAESTPTRISFLRDGATIRAAAITDSAVIPERVIGAGDDAVLGQLITEMTNPPETRLGELSGLLARLLVHRDFRESVERAGTIVFEVDRAMARVHWEMLANRIDGLEKPEPIGLKIHVARQLRTAYSAAPSVERALRQPLRALVIGDPGDPREDASLESARSEALKVKQLLEGQGVEVVAFIGAPSVPREGELQDIPAAQLLAVLNELMKGNYDILHYSGHGDFDPSLPDSTGWVFQGGLLTSRHLELVDMAPSLVFANACLSAMTAGGRTGGVGGGTARGEADLLPGLADEFFRRGVRNYVGTAWRVSDEGAVRFAETFYKALLTPAAEDGAKQPTIGSSLLQARGALYKEKKYGALWAAYQHYGDPQHTLIVPSA